MTQETINAIEAADRFIAENYKAAPRLHEISQAAGVSMYHLHRRFREHFGITPKARIDSLKLADSVSMLDRGDQIGLIAKSLGYKCQGTFTNAFRAKFGITPREYRKSRKAAA